MGKYLKKSLNAGVASAADFTLVNNKEEKTLSVYF